MRRVEAEEAAAHPAPAGPVTQARVIRAEWTKLRALITLAALVLPVTLLCAVAGYFAAVVENPGTRPPRSRVFGSGQDAERDTRRHGVEPVPDRAFLRTV